MCTGRYTVPPKHAYTKKPNGSIETGVGTAKSNSDSWRDVSLSHGGPAHGPQIPGHGFEPPGDPFPLFKSNSPHVPKPPMELRATAKAFKPSSLQWSREPRAPHVPKPREPPEPPKPYGFNRDLEKVSGQDGDCGKYRGWMAIMGSVRAGWQLWRVSTLAERAVLYLPLHDGATRVSFIHVQGMIFSLVLDVTAMHRKPVRGCRPLLISSLGSADSLDLGCHDPSSARIVRSAASSGEANSS
ncbi:hypothetical protein VNO77_43992 [Canavalia gladiata]|uniref:Uncharacterized protein n=1 Tax=Canavalia gladiata TaxID=3824 RepID=A0AAN9JXG2_CANGL